MKLERKKIITKRKRQNIIHIFFFILSDGGIGFRTDRNSVTNFRLNRKRYETFNWKSTGVRCDNVNRTILTIFDDIYSTNNKLSVQDKSVYTISWRFCNRIFEIISVYRGIRGIVYTMAVDRRLTRYLKPVGRRF